MTEYIPGQPAHVVHSALKSAVATMAAAKQNALLWFGEILERKLYLERGYSSIHAYAERELGFSTSKTYDFLNICRRLERLPKVKEKVEAGELGYTHTREMLKVTDESNQDAWLKVALNTSRRELVKEVKLARREAAAKKVGQPSLVPTPRTRPAAAVPVRVGLEFSPAQFARYEALWEKIRKMGAAPADKVEALLEIMETYLAENSTRVENPAPPVQIHVHQCPDCENATVQTGKGELQLSPAERERAACDCQISRPDRRNTTSIPPATRRQVLARARHRCEHRGCGHTRYLEVHHKVPRISGGTNAKTNLVCLCSACHKLVHEKPSGFYVRSPRVTYAAAAMNPSARTPTDHLPFAPPPNAT